MDLDDEVRERGANVRVCVCVRERRGPGALYVCVCEKNGKGENVAF